MLPADRGPGVAKLAEQLADLLELLGVAIEPGLLEVTKAEQIDGFQPLRELALLHVEGVAQVLDDVLGATELAMRELDLLVLHRDARLEQERSEEHTSELQSPVHL